jgi:spermidine synthase
MSLLSRVTRLEAVAFVIGFAIMTFELTAARVVAPYLGTTIYSWTSIIGVILAALAGGYALGGNIADSRKRIEDIILLLALAAISIGLVAIFKDELLSWISTTSFPLQMQALCASLLLFAPPTLILGAASPYLSRLSITDVATSGHRLSRVEAASTIGSLVGTFLTGYILFSLIGSHSIIIFLGVLLIGSSFLLGYKKYLGLRLAMLVLVILAGFASPKPQLSGFIQQFDTAYSRAIVRDVGYDSQRVRALQTDNSGLQSGVYVDGRDDLALPYVRAFAYAATLKPNAERHLIIGGGAFTFPEFLAKQYPSSKVDTVEIDDRFPEISRQYFGFDQPKNLHIIAADGRQFLNTNKTTYDMIFLDAFNALVPPFQLMTAEAVSRTKSSLDPNGMVIANIISASEGYRSELIRYAYNTFKTSYTHVAVYRIDQRFPVNTRQNLLLLASNQPIAESRLTRAAAVDPLLRPLTANRLSLAENQARILTDNYAPVEQLAVW